jgi:hypothetical protein
MQALTRDRQTPLSSSGWYRPGAQQQQQVALLLM